MDQSLQDLVIRLTESAVRNTASVINNRITAIKTKRDAAEQVAELEQIVNELIGEKTELVRIAQAFADELVAQRISDSEVQYITENLVPVLKTLAASGATDGGNATNSSAETIDLFEPLLSAEMVTVLQLLGFNFRKAIGEPLTDLTARAILRLAPAAGDSAAELKTLELRREIAFYEVAKDADAFARMRTLTGQS